MSDLVILRIDASAGAAGDMLLAALLDAGADLGAVNEALNAVAPGLAVRASETSRNGMRALRLQVQVPPGRTLPARWRDLRPVIADAPLSAGLRDRSLDVLRALAEAEAAVHGIDVDEVHFHEIAAWDTIADVVGILAAVASLAPAVRVSATPVGVGAGTVRTQHGILPVPAPAVVELLRRCGAPFAAGPATFEACTPTAAAVLSCLVDEWGDPGPAVVVSTGTGAGSRDPDTHPNVTRVLRIRRAAGGRAAAADAVVLQANVDDMDPRLWPDVIERLIAAGASDAWLVPISMKKGRPAVMLCVLAAPELEQDLAGLVVELTTAIGMRVLPVGKRAARRELVTVQVAGQSVRVKVARWNGRIVNVQPEWEDVAAASHASGRAPKQILGEAQAAAQTLIARG